jgi:hypothetical protein
MDEAIAQLRNLNEPVPKPLRLPTEEEIRKVEKELGVKFHPDYERFLLEASDVVYGVLEPATIPDDSGHTYNSALSERGMGSGSTERVDPYHRG